jgi:hypothetical protein
VLHSARRTGDEVLVCHERAATKRSGVPHQLVGSRRGGTGDQYTKPFEILAGFVRKEVVNTERLGHRGLG